MKLPFWATVNPPRPFRLHNCQCSYPIGRGHPEYAHHHITRQLKMSTAQTTTKPTTKKFGKGERTVPASSDKAQKYYPAEDERKPKKVWRPSILRGSERDIMGDGQLS